MSENIYKFKINFLEIKNQLGYTQVVYIINYTFITTDSTGTYSFSQPGQVEIPSLEEGQEFIPFDQLSEELVVRWIEENLPDQDLGERTEWGDKGLARVIELALHQTDIVYHLPWMPVPQAPVVIEQVVPSDIEAATQNHLAILAAGEEGMKRDFPGWGTPDFKPWLY